MESPDAATYVQIKHNPLGRIPKSQCPFDPSIPDHLDSDLGKLYVFLKCFRNTDATVKSVSSNSISKNSNMSNLANSKKLKTLKKLKFTSRQFLTLS